jgi:hypothetical protein
MRDQGSEEYAGNGPWSELMCRSGTKVWVVEAHEDMKMGQVKLLTVEAREGDLIAYGRAWAAIKKISGCGVSFGPVGGRHGRMERVLTILLMVHRLRSAYVGSVWEGRGAIPAWERRPHAHE